MLQQPNKNYIHLPGHIKNLFNIIITYGITNISIEWLLEPIYLVEWLAITYR